MPFQQNYKFVCRHCSLDDHNVYTLIKSSWVVSVISAMAYLMWKTQRDCFKVSEARPPARPPAARPLPEPAPPLRTRPTG